MSSTVEHIGPGVLRDLADGLARARQRACEQHPHGNPSTPAEWEAILEANAAALLDEIPSVELTPGRVVRYRVFGHERGNLRLRPFVARRDTDVGLVREALDWHPPPDSVTSPGEARPNRDVDLLYSHFRYPLTAQGFFEYWLTVQEIWASSRWIHSRVLSNLDDLAAVTSKAGWQRTIQVERAEPCVIVSNDGAALVAAFLLCPLERQTVVLDRITIGADRSIRYAEPVTVAIGPRGHQLH